MERRYAYDRDSELYQLEYRLTLADDATFHFTKKARGVAGQIDLELRGSWTTHEDTIVLTPDDATPPISVAVLPDDELGIEGCELVRLGPGESFQCR